MPYLSSISVYTVKSFEAVSVSSARIVEGGGLEHDREFGLFDAEGKYINGKRNAKVHRIRALFDPCEQCVMVTNLDEGGTACFEIPGQLVALESWLSEYFGQPVSVRRNAAGGFPDDKNATGPTVIGKATLETVASWYDRLECGETHRRFRTNLMIADAPPFWEDRLYDKADEVVRFKIGDVECEGTNPCQRCVVPTRRTDTGEITPDFSNEFMAKRKETLPEWANVSRFNHFYRLAVNTRIPASEVGKVLRVGDPILLVG